VTRRREWAALAALVAVSAGLRAWAALRVPGPWIAPDEMVYSLLGRDLYLHGSLRVLGGATPFYSLLTPALAGLPLTTLGLPTGHDVLQGVQALVMSLAAVPVYLWARTLVSSRSALAAAVLTVAVPGLAYSGLVMTEVLFYPLLVLAAWAGAEAIARPSRRTQTLLVVAVLAVAATRIQGIVLLPVLATAALVDAGFARSWANLRRLLPAAGALVGLVVAWTAWRLASGSGTLGGYDVIAGASYSAGGAAKFVVYHLASVLILCGLFPAAAVALMAVRAAGHGEPDPRVRAYLAVASSLTAWLVVEVGVFASRYSDRIVERNLIALAPVLFIGLVLWLERGPDGHYLERSAIALVAAAVLLVLPVKRYVNVFGTHDAMTLIPLYRLEQATSPGTLALVYSLVAAALAVVFALVPRRRLAVLPVVLLVAFATASVDASRYVADQASAQQRSFLGNDPRWIDRSGQGSVAYLYDGEPDWNQVWATLFWNHRIDRVYDLAGTIPGPLPQTPADVQADGTLFLPPRASGPPAYAVVSPSIQLVGDRVAQAGLVLWHVDSPLRLSSTATGLQSNGDIYATVTARLLVYGCHRGSFQVTLLVKQPETVEIRVNGRLEHRLSFSTPIPSWHGVFAANGRGGECTLEVTPTGLLGTTVFEFDRA
jgi:Dolichyl-phosphate-mannose-protein mannosyltransferase